MTGLTPVSFRKDRAHEPRLSAPYVPGIRSDRYWAEDEIAILRERYPAFGTSGCLPLLPRRTIDQIRAKANALALKAPGERQPRERAHFTPGMDARIRDAFPTLTRRGAVAALAAELGIRRHQLSQRLERLELTVPRIKEPVWTDAEIALMARVPLHDLRRCAAIFRDHGFSRSPNAIAIRAKRLEISRRTHETLSARGAARILGIDDKSVTALCIAGDLKAGRRGSKRLAQQGGDAWAIEPAELRRYVLDHIDRIDIRKVDKVAFVALLVGSDAIDPRAGASAGPDEELRAANRALCDRVAALQAENARLAALADRSADAPPRPRSSWRDRVRGGRRRFG